MYRLLALILLVSSAMPAALAPPAGVVLQLTVAPSGALFVGTWCGVYNLPPGTTAWQELPGLRDVPAQRLAIATSDVALVATAGWWPGGVWRGRVGSSWQQVLDTTDARLAASPDSARVYAAAAGLSGPSGIPLGVQRSDDAGATWAPTGHSAMYALPRGLAVATDPGSGDDIVLLATQAIRLGGTALLRSRDRGATWEPYPAYTALGQPGVVEPQVFLAGDGVTFYLTDHLRDINHAVDRVRLFRGAATGDALREIVLPAEITTEELVDVVTLAQAPVVATQHGVWRQNADATWTRIDGRLGGAVVYDLAAAPDSLLAATSVGAYRYTGNTWKAVAGGLPVCTTPGRTVFEPIPEFPSGPEHVFVPETSHALSYGFRAYWERNGALPVFGYPLSEEFDERNLDLDRAFATQYFERERFEYHPEYAGTADEVQLGRLGAELLAAQGRDWRHEDGTANPFPAQLGGCRSFDVGGEARTVCGPFLEYWQRHGLDRGRPGITFDESLLLFGLPLTAPKMETNSSGDLVLTQWFERARLEYHSGNPASNRVLLGRLGSEVLQGRGIAAP